MGEYCALIRTFNSAKTLPYALKALARQTVPPSAYVIVDSGSTDDTLDHVPPNATVHRFVGVEFNYAEALNQGLTYVATRYTLIVSSHTLLLKADAVGRGLDLLESRSDLGAAYFVEGSATTYLDDYCIEVIDRKNFTGFNGLSNSCALIRTELLRKRPFRAELYAAEDQDWARWVFDSERLGIARIAAAGMWNVNPRRWSQRKRLNEYLCIAYYVNRDLLRWPHLLEVGSRILKQPGIRVRERAFNLLLLVRLLMCRFRRPRGISRYFSLPRSGRNADR